MNVFDFDKTIFPSDSSVLFIRYCAGKYTKRMLRDLPEIGMRAAGYLHDGKEADATCLKEQLFSFLSVVNDPDALVQEFWKKNMRKINSWYLKMRRPDDVIISASPEFLLAPVQKELRFHLIATRMDKYSGKIAGVNCHDYEKVRRFFEVYPEGGIENFYSDSLSDAPVANISDNAFLVKGENIVKWPGKN